MAVMEETSYSSAILLLTLILLVIHWWQSFGYWRRVGIPGPFPLPIIGTCVSDFTKGINAAIDDDVKRYGKLVGGYSFGTKRLIIADTEITEELLMKRNDCVRDKLTESLDDTLGQNMLFLMNAEPWKRMRRIWSPYFSIRSLKQMVPKLNRCGDDLISALQEDEILPNGIVELTRLCRAYALSTVADTSFGYEMNPHTMPDDPFARLPSLLLGSFYFQLAFLMPYIFNMLKRLRVLDVKVIPKAATDILIDLIRKKISDLNEDEPQEHHDFCHVTLEKSRLHLSRTDADNETRFTNSYDENEALTQILAFIVAGIETTELTLSYVLYNLAVNTHCQEKLFTEILEVMQNRKEIDYNAVKDMKYLDMIIKETLRRDTPIAGSLRVTTSTITVKGVKIPKGTLLMFAFRQMQNDPEIWSDPNKFDPERFTLDKVSQRPLASYTPFSIGQRQCMGMRLALLQIKMAVMKTILNYRLETCAATEIPLKYSKGPVLRPLNGIKVKVIARNQ